MKNYRALIGERRTMGETKMTLVNPQKLLLHLSPRPEGTLPDHNRKNFDANGKIIFLKRRDPKKLKIEREREE